MRQWLVARLIRLLTRLLRWLDPPPATEVRDCAATLITVAAGFADGTSGDYKRAYVYSRLQKAYPHTPKRTLSRLIEDIYAPL